LSSTTTVLICIAAECHTVLGHKVVKAGIVEVVARMWDCD
jgi:hypothetical protein